MCMINEMKRRIDELEAKRRWVSVKDRFPDVNTEVIGFYSESEGFEPDCVGNVWHSDGYFTGMIYSRDPYPVCVTHWMPLPDAPR